MSHAGQKCCVQPQGNCTPESPVCEMRAATGGAVRGYGRCWIPQGIWLLITKTPFATRDYSQRNSLCWRPTNVFAHPPFSKLSRLTQRFFTHARPLLCPAGSERVNHSMEKMWVGDKSCDDVGLKLNGTDERSRGYLWSFLFHIELVLLWYHILN